MTDHAAPTPDTTDPHWRTSRQWHETEEHTSQPVTRTNFAHVRDFARAASSSILTAVIAAWTHLVRATDRLGWSLLDPGWPLVIAAVGLLGATVLVPAMDRLDEAMWERDRATAYEHNRLERIELHTSYLAAIKRGEPGLVRSLTAQQLNRIPAGESPLLPTSSTLYTPASVFRDLEPSPIAIEPRRVKNSLLEQWTTSQRVRPWLILAGGVLLLFGLLPMHQREELDET